MFLSVWPKGNHIINKNISDYERPEVWKSYFYIYTGHFFMYMNYLTVNLYDNYTNSSLITQVRILYRDQFGLDYFLRFPQKCSFKSVCSGRKFHNKKNISCVYYTFL